MRLLLQRVAELGDDLVGRLTGPGLDLWTMERRWGANVPFRSCVPAGFYCLEPHNGTKYQDTFALIGADVSHAKEPGVPRYACVLHWARRGSLLSGCVSASRRVALRDDGGAELVESALIELFEWLRSDDSPHYLTIREIKR